MTNSLCLILNLKFYSQILPVTLRRARNSQKKYLQAQKLWCFRFEYKQSIRSFFFIFFSTSYMMPRLRSIRRAETVRNLCSLPVFPQPTRNIEENSLHRGKCKTKTVEFLIFVTNIQSCESSYVFLFYRNPQQVSEMHPLFA